MGRHDADQHFFTRGLAPQFTDRDGIVITVAWTRAVDEGSIVGTCRAFDQTKRACTGYLKARPAYESGPITWYEAECMRCGGYLASPNGKTLTRSSARSEMPPGEWERRTKVNGQLFGKTEG